MKNKQLKRIAFEIDEDLKNKVKAKASSMGKSLKEVMTGFLQKWSEEG